MAGRPDLNNDDYIHKIWKLNYKFTVIKIAKKLKVNRRSLYRWMDGTRNPTPDHKQKLQRLYNYHLRGY